MRLHPDEMSERCGCQAKLSGSELRRLLRDAFHAGAGSETSPLEFEDCAVLELTADRLLATTDFGPLVGPYPLRAGHIAATHALSDVYAVGGRPRQALAMLIVDRRLPRHAASEVLAGMVAACRCDGVRVVGGHTVVGPEAMAGLSVIGTADSSILSKRGACSGDVLLLSKPVGLGMVVRAYRSGELDDAALEPALAVMEISNRQAAGIAMETGVRAATDVTGFGLLGHLVEMLEGERLGATLDLRNVPVIDAARSLPALYAHSVWIDDNLDYCRRSINLVGVRDRIALAPLLDPQTSGGLLVAASPSVTAPLGAAGFTRIGTVTAEPTLEIVG
jgi:selenide,water dikinase